MIGRRYVLRGRLVIVTCAWNGTIRDLPRVPGIVTARTAPRNVEIEDEDGSRTVRPFRGLRRER